MPDPWPFPFADEPINHLRDGFKVVWINQREPFWLPRMEGDAGRTADLPDSWLRPVKYLDGTIYDRIEVFEKPDEQHPITLISRLTAIFTIEPTTSG